MLDVSIRGRVGDFETDVVFSGSAGVTALFGQSGSGKTTIVKMIGGLVRPASGRIVLDDRVLFDSTSGIDVPARRRRIGHVFQDSRLFPHLTVRQNLAYGRRFARGNHGPAFDEVVELLGLSPLLARRPRTLSGGEKQRVAIGRALYAAPRALVMDEPLASLDAARKAEILPYLDRLRREAGVPIIYVSHAIGEVTRLAETLVVLSEGRIVAAGPPAEVMSRLDLGPATGRHEAGAILSGRVAGHDDAYALTTVRVDEHEIQVPALDLAPGTRVRFRVRARDVALAKLRPKDISVRNVLEGYVTEIATNGGAYAEIVVAIGRQRLRARITRKSAEELGLARGEPVWALLKSIAVERGMLTAEPGSDEGE